MANLGMGLVLWLQGINLKHLEVIFFKLFSDLPVLLWEPPKNKMFRLIERIRENRET